MTNEEFQNLVLEKLGSLEVSMKGLDLSVKDLEQGQKNLKTSVKGIEQDQKNLEISVKGLELGQKNLEVSIQGLEKGQQEIKKDIKAIVEQTADLIEFKEEVRNKLDTLIHDNKSTQEILGEHEVAIRTLRRRVI